ncbi:Uma2 family endonuclease [Streptomyces sp. NPDC059095]|uniref:Uma2 family endonuclease n=1 Tax=Streptomyces sp. NPDC059095 TaxID=3346726 RepID=UPI0036B7D8A8
MACLLIPDIAIVDASAAATAEATTDAHDVLVVVEIASPSTRVADRKMKPHLYAAAGIAHYWRVELEPAPRIYFGATAGRRVRRPIGGSGGGRRLGPSVPSRSRSALRASPSSSTTPIAGRSHDSGAPAHVHTHEPSEQSRGRRLRAAWAASPARYRSPPVASGALVAMGRLTGALCMP